MEIEDYPRKLKILVNDHLKNYLKYSSKQKFLDKIDVIEGSIKRGDDKWNIKITRDEAITFKETKVNDVSLQADICCDISGESNKIKEHNIILRIWSADEDICYRDDFDSKSIKESLETKGWKRTMVRFHIDKKDENTTKEEPMHHLHLGGNPAKNEFFWFPEDINIPRFPYPPLDIILLSELVLVNFFPKKSRDLRKKTEWRSLIRKSQELFIKKHIENWNRYLNREKNTLLGYQITGEIE